MCDPRGAWPAPGLRPLPPPPLPPGRSPGTGSATRTNSDRAGPGPGPVGREACARCPFCGGDGGVSSVRERVGGGAAQDAGPDWTGRDRTDFTNIVYNFAVLSVLRTTFDDCLLTDNKMLALVSSVLSYRRVYCVLSCVYCVLF